jgi:hypothetical protein
MTIAASADDGEATEQPRAVVIHTDAAEFHRFERMKECYASPKCGDKDPGLLAHPHLTRSRPPPRKMCAQEVTSSNDFAAVVQKLEEIEREARELIEPAVQLIKTCADRAASRGGRETFAR